MKINQSLNCNISNCVHLIECKKENCNMKYIGETKRILKFRVAEHKGYITNQDETKATGKHFNTPGHSLSDLSITILEIQEMNSTEKKEKLLHKKI